MLSLEKIEAERLVSLDLDGLQLFSRYRRHRLFSADELRAIARAEFRDAAEKGVAFALVQGEAVLGLCVAYPLEWDSTHFGLSMGRVVLNAAPDVPGASLSDLVQRTLQAGLRNFELRHVSCEVDIDDYACLNVLLGRGFEILDLKRTWCASRLREDIDFVRNRRSVRPYCAQDAGAVEQILQNTHFPSRFARDPFLDPSRVRNMYELWFRRLLDKSLAGRALAVVFERQGSVVSCGAIDEVDFSFAGLRQTMMSGGLYACTSRGVGGYAPIMHHLTSESIRRHGVVDTTASLNNTAVARVLDGFRSYSGSVIRYCLRLNASG